MLVRALALGLLTCALSAIAPAPSTADGVRDIDLTGFSEMVVDREHGRIFISQGNSGVVVLGLDGLRVADLPGLAGAQGMWLDPSGDTLWVAASDSGAVGEVDTATLDVTTHQTGVGSCPHDVATGEGIVWFADECGASSIAALDPLSGLVTSFGNGSAPPEDRRWRLATSPALPERLFAIGDDAGNVLAQFQTTGGQAPALTELRRVGTDGGRDLVVTPTGDALIETGGEQRRVDSLAWAGKYAAMDSVAVRHDGRIGGSYFGAWGVYDEIPTASAQYGRPPFAKGSWAGERVQPRGVAWGDVALYVVTRRVSDGAFQLHAVLPMRPTSVSISVGHTKVRYGSTHRVSVRLTGPRSGRVVSLYARPAGDRMVLLAKQELNSDPLVIPYRFSSTTTFTAIYEGDAETLSSRDTVQVRVPTEVDVLPRRYARFRSTEYIYRVGKRAYFAIRVGPPKPAYRARLQVWADIEGDQVLVAYTDRLSLSPRGVAKVYLPSAKVFVGLGLTARATWFKSARGNVGGRSPEVHFRFTH